MNKYAVLKDSVVENIIIADQSFATTLGAVEVDDTVAIGDRWDGEKYIKPSPPEEPVPEFVYPRQIRLALTRAGLRSAVENYVSTGSQDLKDWWEFSNEVYRNNPYVIAAASALGVTDSQLDDLWRLARGL